MSKLKFIHDEYKFSGELNIKGRSLLMQLKYVKIGEIYSVRDVKVWSDNEKKYVIPSPRFINYLVTNLEFSSIHKE
jgi:hypothetical protein